MAKFIKEWKNKLPFRIFEIFAYASMLLAILAFFTGNGEFIYEGF